MASEAAGASGGVAPNASRFPVLPSERAQIWQGFPRWERAIFPTLVGLELEEIREGYARMRLPYRPELDQPIGAMHGGAIATLIDTAVVPAIGSAYSGHPKLLTIDMHVQFLAPVVKQDAVAEGWVEKRGRSICFCRVEVRTASGELAATASLVYRVRPPES